MATPVPPSHPPPGFMAEEAEQVPLITIEDIEGIPTGVHDEFVDALAVSHTDCLDSMVAGWANGIDGKYREHLELVVGRYWKTYPAVTISWVDLLYSLQLSLYYLCRNCAVTPGESAGGPPN